METPTEPKLPTYRLRDLGRAPSILSLARVPLAALFPFVVDDPRAALGVIALSGLSDVLDGWWARRFNQTSALGALLDGLTDKVFVLAVALTLLVTGRLSSVELALLGARDLGELALLAYTFASGRGLRRGEQPRADVYGKATTFAQFVAVVLALFAHPAKTQVAWVTGALGLLTAAHYARRAFRPPSPS
ncbi:MAG: CDP-alcohol phosphatidyltransferase family protein [Polyangiales bacterium]